MQIQSIKFYVNVPTVENGAIVHSAKGTYIAVGEPLGGRPTNKPSTTIKSLMLEVTPGPGGLLKITQVSEDNEKKTFIYQLADILGRIEITE